MPPQSKQLREQRLEKKRLAEKKRRDKIKNDPILRLQQQEKDRRNYMEKKRKGIIVPISQMSPRQQKIMRKKSRESSNRYNQKKHLRKLMELEEEQIIIEDNDDSEIDTVVDDPLRLTPSPSPNYCQTIESPASPRSNSDISTTQMRITRSARRNIMKNFPERDSDFDFDPISNRDSLTPSPQISLSESNTTAASGSARSSYIARKQNSAFISAKKKSPWKHLLRKIKYRNERELLIKDKQILKMKRLNEKYKKQLQRLKYRKSARIHIERRKEHINKIRHQTENLCVESSKSSLKRDIEKFFEEDENSRICPGKKEYVTRNKIKKQKRFLNFTLHQLHKKFLQQHPEYKISYSFFCTLRPFWTVVPNVNARETCLCILHENMNLVVMALRRNGIIVENSSYEVLKSLCCDSKNVKCLSGACNSCKNKHLNYQEFDNSKESHYWLWTKTKKRYIKDGQEKFTLQSLKQKVLAHPKNIIEHFESLLKPYMNHCANIVSQNNYIKNLKSNLKTNECIVHCDFSENYNTKYASEIQAFHFGSSRQQISLHTSVIYYMQNGELCNKSFCTLSECLRHDAIAIWQHLGPVLDFINRNIPELESLHFVSDSPSAQYRNKKMFYVMAKLHWDFTSLRRVIWNYSEKGHGKGAPDGVGGVIKRTADRIVAEGNDIPNIDLLIYHLGQRCPGVMIEEVHESGILEKELLIPFDLKEFRGTMKVHQAIWTCNNPEVLAMRQLSCDFGKCSVESNHCPHGQHIGFYNIGTFNNTNVTKTIGRNRTSIKRKNLGKISVQNNQIDNISSDDDRFSCSKGPSVKNAPKTNPSYGLAGSSVKINQTDTNIIQSDDSFWNEVPQVTENVISSSMTNVVFSALHGNADSDSSDYNIF